MHGAFIPTEPSTARAALRVRRWRLFIWTVVLALMAVGFAGYLMPGVRLNWETIVALCGF